MLTLLKRSPRKTWLT
ncbi:UNVERIFIED_CONTAM: hypothetical protein GTU68_004219 [Idotea baltica]|nr:hypothetical protein [Idotea baltica]